MTRFEIVLEDLEIRMFLGIHQFEKDTMQRVLVSARIDIEVAAVDGAVHFDYDAVADHVRGYNGQAVATQEELTTRIHAHILSLPGAVRAEVRSRKPDVYADCGSVGIVYRG